jgi:hypothetical protein
VVVTAVLVLAGAVQSEEVIDQQNDPVTTESYHCGAPPILNKAILQSFVPAKSNLSAVELRLRAGSAFPTTDVTTTIRIRASSPTGTVLAESSASVAANQANLTQLVVRFEFDALALTPGGTYFIEWDTPANTTLSWMGADDVDHYAAGSAYSCAGSVWKGGITDFNFTTYATVASSPHERIDGLLDLVDEMTSARVAATLTRHLTAASNWIERDRPGLALVRMERFGSRVRFLIRTGRISESDGDQLLDEAQDIITELRGTIQDRRGSGRWWTRSWWR